MAKNLLVEIGTEELPARFVIPGIKSFKESAEKRFKDAKLSFDEIITAGTFRRLSLFVKNLAEKQPDVEEEILGPPEKVAFDEKGNPTKAAIGFAKKVGVPVEKLKIKETPRGKYVCVKKEIKGASAKELLPKLIYEIVSSIKFPKSMRWGNYDFRFARPIRWLCCIFGEDLIEVEIAGVKSQKLTQGHRFLSKEPIILKSANWEEYLNLLKKNWVIVVPEKRLKKTLEKINEVSLPFGEVEKDEELLKENANLVEYPFPCVGSFPEDFLKLPEPLVITTLKEHQRYFCIKKNGKLTNYFVAVNNNLARNPEVVKKGHEKVTKARLEDAKFYFEKDLETPLEDKVKLLDGIVYHIKCGTLWDKTKRLMELVTKVSTLLEFNLDEELLRKCAYYSKADLASEVVGEFPSLQGIMGSIYAEYFGIKEVAKAIYEQYLPLPGKEELPETLEGTVLSLADKFDHTCTMFAIGEKPSGEADPYGVRRSAYGIIKILCGKKLRFSIKKGVKEALKVIKSQGISVEDGLEEEVTEFIKKRLESELISSGMDKMVVLSVIDVSDDPFDIVLRAEALEKMRKSKEFLELVIGFKRVAQMLKSIDTKSLPEVNSSLFSETAEKELFEKVKDLSPELNSLLNQKNYEAYLEVLLKLKPYIDKFFDEVFVMVEDEKLRNNRLSILKSVSELFDAFGDLRKFI
ncbi:MAG: glycine--tRNA ligase subunit beta [Thermodesulfobacteria bacterium]|nr:glycine--tRNA ligase subunit beta [Thermodesulfobacteriota bacterium]